MATDRESLGNTTLITRIIYSMDSGNLMRRVRISVKDTDGVKHLISNEIENVGNKQNYKKGLKTHRNRIQDRVDEKTDDIDFYNEQITDIEAL
jgi:hypothetical protein